MILIVDDKQENIFSLKKLLQLYSYEVDTASSGEEALKKILKNEYVLIILDVQMPGMDGYEVAEIVRGYSRTKYIPILFLSAVNIDKRFITKGYAAGGVDYVTKPFDPDLLMLKVQTFYKLHEQNKELNDIQLALKEEIETRKKAEKKLQESNLLLEDRVKERTRELLEMNQELELSNAELQQYASVASHDLSEPLRKIITFGTILQDRFLKDQPAANELMIKVINSTQRMRTLIDDLLNFSKLSAETQFIPTDLNEILKDVINDLELSIQEKDATLHLINLPTIAAIPGQMRQMFQNILSNALKFGKDDIATEINISFDSTNERSFSAPFVENGKYLRIYIRDNGIGFDNVFSGKIFTLFQRLHGKGKYEGTGIGLAIVKKIVDKHNGLIHAEGSEDEGATFTILLPYTQHSLTIEEPLNK
jgi:signal transduction histidine kinase